MWSQSIEINLVLPNEVLSYIINGQRCVAGWRCCCRFWKCESLKRISLESGAEIFLQNPESRVISGKERCVLVRGSLEAVTKAEQMILEILRKKEAWDDEVKLPKGKTVMKWVVTNAGPTSRTFKIGKLPGTAKNRWSCSPVTELLEKIMKETETNIVISEKESSGFERLLYIAGEMDDVVLAVSSVMKLFGGEPYKPEVHDQKFKKPSASVKVPFESLAFIQREDQSGIAALEKKTGAKLEVKDVSELFTGSLDHVLVVTGTEAQIADVQFSLKGRLARWKFFKESDTSNAKKDDDHTLVKIALTELAATYLANSSQLDTIVETSGVDIKILDDEPVIAPDRLEFKLVLAGPLGNILQAQGMLIEELYSSPEGTLNQLKSTVPIPPHYQKKMQQGDGEAAKLKKKAKAARKAAEEAAHDDGGCSGESDLDYEPHIIEASSSEDEESESESSGKEEETNQLKQVFLCAVCEIDLDTANALDMHLKGQKHKKSFEKYLKKRKAPQPEVPRPAKAVKTAGVSEGPKAAVAEMTAVVQESSQSTAFIPMWCEPTSIFIGNLNPSTSSDKMKCLLEKCGAFSNWTLMKGFGYCTFVTRGGATQGLKLLNDYELDGHKLYATFIDADKLPMQARVWTQPSNIQPAPSLPDSISAGKLPKPPLPSAPPPTWLPPPSSKPPRTPLSKKLPPAYPPPTLAAPSEKTVPQPTTPVQQVPTAPHSFPQNVAPTQAWPMPPPPLPPFGFLPPGAAFPPARLPPPIPPPAQNPFYYKAPPPRMPPPTPPGIIPRPMVRPAVLAQPSTVLPATAPIPPAASEAPGPSLSSIKTALEMYCNMITDPNASTSKDNSSKCKTVYVGNIPPNSDAKLRAILEYCGVVSKWNPTKGFGFCTFLQVESSIKALRLLNGFELDGHKLVVKVGKKEEAMINRYITEHTQAGLYPVLDIALEHRKLQAVVQFTPGANPAQPFGVSSITPATATKASDEFHNDGTFLQRAREIANQLQMKKSATETPKTTAPFSNDGSFLLKAKEMATMMKKGTGQKTAGTTNTQNQPPDFVSEGLRQSLVNLGYEQPDEGFAIPKCKTCSLRGRKCVGFRARGLTCTPCLNAGDSCDLKIALSQAGSLFKKPTTNAKEVSNPSLMEQRKPGMELLNTFQTSKNRNTVTDVEMDDASSSPEQTYPDKVPKLNSRAAVPKTNASGKPDSAPKVFASKQNLEKAGLGFLSTSIQHLVAGSTVEEVKDMYAEFLALRFINLIQHQTESGMKHTIKFNSLVLEYSKRFKEKLEYTGKLRAFLSNLFVNLPPIMQPFIFNQQSIILIRISEKAINEAEKQPSPTDFQGFVFQKLRQKKLNQASAKKNTAVPNPVEKKKELQVSGKAIVDKTVRKPSPPPRSKEFRVTSSGKRTRSEAPVPVIIDLTAGQATRNEEEKQKRQKLPADVPSKEVSQPSIELSASRTILRKTIQFPGGKRARSSEREVQLGKRDSANLVHRPVEKAPAARQTQSEAHRQASPEKRPVPNDPAPLSRVDQINMISSIIARQAQKVPEPALSAPVSRSKERPKESSESRERSHSQVSRHRHEKDSSERIQRRQEERIYKDQDEKFRRRREERSEWDKMHKQSRTEREHSPFEQPTHRQKARSRSPIDSERISHGSGAKSRRDKPNRPMDRSPEDRRPRMEDTAVSKTSSSRIAMLEEEQRIAQKQASLAKIQAKFESFGAARESALAAQMYSQPAHSTTGITRNPVPSTGITRDPVPPPAENYPVFVSGLARGIDETILQKIFSKFGVIKRLRIAESKATGEFQGFCLVEYATLAAAELAVKFSGSSMMGMTFRVEPRYTRPEVMPAPVFPPAMPYPVPGGPPVLDRRFVSMYPSQMPR